MAKLHPNSSKMLSLEVLSRRFRERGLRFTSQRYAIYQVLAHSTEHPSAEAIYSAVKRSHPTLSMNTVYTTLEALKEIGVASEVSLWHNKARFDANLKPHHHVVCVKCRKITDLYDASLDRLLLSPNARHDYTLLGYRVEFQGYCPSCRTMIRKKKTRKIRSKM
jgi:Fur family transcriptional regulator, peroxide stress response regulator